MLHRKGRRCGDGAEGQDLLRSQIRISWIGSGFCVAPLSIGAILPLSTAPQASHEAAQRKNRYYAAFSARWKLQRNPPCFVERMLTSSCWAQLALDLPPCLSLLDPLTLLLARGTDNLNLLAIWGLQVHGTLHDANGEFLEPPPTCKRTHSGRLWRLYRPPNLKPQIVQPVPAARSLDLEDNVTARVMRLGYW